MQMEMSHRKLVAFRIQQKEKKPMASLAAGVLAETWPMSSSPGVGLVLVMTLSVEGVFVGVLAASVASVPPPLLGAAPASVSLAPLLHHFFSLQPHSQLLKIKIKHIMRYK